MLAGSPSLPKWDTVATAEAGVPQEGRGLEWVAWYKGSRLLKPLGHVPPAEFEKAYHDCQAAPVGMAVFTNELSGKAGAVHSGR
jgi:hypothetical protein